MILIEALISPFFFSVRMPGAYQVAETLPLPPPSTIGGIFAYSYATWKNLEFKKALEKLTVNSWYFAIPISTLTLSSIILRRCRLLQSAEPIRDRNRVINRLPPDVREKIVKSEDIRRLTYRQDLLHALRILKLDYYWEYYNQTFFDAMIRRYIFTSSLYIAGLIPIDETFPISSTRLGDTESYFSIKKIRTIEDFNIEIVSKNVIKTQSYAPLSYLNKNLLIPKGDWPIQLISTPCYLLERERLKKFLSPAVLPLEKRVFRINKKDVEVFSPKEIEVEILSEVCLLEYKSKLLGKEIKVIIPSNVLGEEKCHQ